jgi:hypothetical protein
MPPLPPPLILEFLKSHFLHSGFDLVIFFIYHFRHPKIWLIHIKFSDDATTENNFDKSTDKRAESEDSCDEWPEFQDHNQNES